MDKIFIYGLNRDRKAVLEYLHQNEIAQITDFDASENEMGKKETEKSIAAFNQYIAAAAKALKILDDYKPQKNGIFKTRKNASVGEYSIKNGEVERVNRHIYDIINADKDIKKNIDSVAKINVKLSQIEPYSSLDIPMNFKGTKTTLCKIGAFTGERSEEEIINKLNDMSAGGYHFEILHKTKRLTCIWIIYLKKCREGVENALSDIGFFEPGFSLSHRVTAEKIKVLSGDRDMLLSQNEKIKEKITEFAAYREEIELFYDHLVMRREKYEALSHLGITENTFVISGFVPKRYSEGLLNELSEKFGVYAEAETAESGEAPVVFSNNAFSEPVEGITADYSMPSPNDIDPNPIMAFFYYLFFGMMFSDAGYGALMMIVCGILGFGGILEKEKRRSFKMFFWCGASTTFWGLMYGSFFGDMIDTVSQKFFDGSVSLKPVLFNPTQKPLELLIISVAFGMIHILTALSIKFYILWRDKKRADAICDTGFWILALLGISFYAAGALTGVVGIDSVGIALAATGFLGIAFTGGRNNKNIIGKLFGGILSLYDITSYVGDILSYSRLMALGLATGVIASVINVLASLGGATPFGVISYIVISVFGHALNFSINCLGAYVHTNRLQYVEFYQKFYEGGGKRFEPFAMNTKYFNFSENK